MDEINEAIEEILETTPSIDFVTIFVFTKDSCKRSVLINAKSLRNFALEIASMEIHKASIIQKIIEKQELGAEITRKACLDDGETNA